MSTPQLSPPLQNTSSPRDKEPPEIQKVLKWQEERIARRLKGEYESAVLHLSELIQSNMSTTMNVSSVRVEGAKNTRQSFLGSIINPILLPKSAQTSENSNLESVLHTTRHLAYILNRTDIFSSVEATLERSRDVMSGPEDVDIVFKTREKGRYFLNTSTELGNNEGSASATGKIRNVFGGAEVFEANVSFGTQTKRSFRGCLAGPLTPNLETYGELSAYGVERDNTAFASSKETLRGVKAIIRNGTPLTGAHELVYEAVLRHIGDLAPTASLSMREAAGQSSKSSVAYTYVIDTRNDRIAATRGHYAKISNEYAGLGGDASFYKAEAETQISRPILDGVSLSFAAKSGLLWGISKSTLFPDRFQLGGPTSVRAFKSNTLGPRDGNDSLGGDLYWSAGLSVISNIPKKPHWPVKTHVWINAGRLDGIDKSRPLVDNIRSTLTKPSISAGVGLVYRFDPVRVEVNFGVPLVASKSDGCRRGVQVGVGLDFL